MIFVLCAAQKPIAQQPGAKGGNGQKRIRLFIRPETGSFDIPSLEGRLTFFSNKSVYSMSELSAAASEADTKGSFNPNDIEDARKRTMAAIVQREGQPRFRRELLLAYGNACAVTGCVLEDVLEAAHIESFKGVLTNSIENGLLLRSDIHTLFDKGLIAIDTNTWKILIDLKLEGTEYKILSQQTLRLPVQMRCRPSIEALCKHRESSNF